MNGKFPVPPPGGPIFRFPGGRWCYLHRAIVFDSWLNWSHALPARRSEQVQLRSEQVRNIATLARLITTAQGRLSKLRAKECPFLVHQWWSPNDPKWSHGRRCVIEITPREADEWLPLLPADRVRSAARSTHIAELLLIRPTSKLRPGNDRPVATRGTD
jgi:hypothetical protein